MGVGVVNAPPKGITPSAGFLIADLSAVVDENRGKEVEAVYLLLFGGFSLSSGASGCFLTMYTPGAYGHNPLGLTGFATYMSASVTGSAGKALNGEFDKGFGPGVAWTYLTMGTGYSLPQIWPPPFIAGHDSGIDMLFGISVKANYP